jgi:hypothetical protein
VSALSKYSRLTSNVTSRGLLSWTISSESQAVPTPSRSPSIWDGFLTNRARQSAALFDSGEQSNLAATHVGGLFGHDGTLPAELYSHARAEVRAPPSKRL